MLEYPGEGPECKKCGQKYNRQSRADNCKHKKLCTLCNRCFKSLQKHMVKEHGGWACVKRCNHKHTHQRQAAKCKCKLCEFCQKYVHNYTEHCDTEHIAKSSKRKEQLKKAYLMWKQNLTPVKQAQRYESNNKQKKLTRDAGKSQEKNFECPKCSHPFVYPGHVKRCACKECKICNQHTRDLQEHMKHNHAEHYVKKKLDLYAPLRKGCIGGVIDFAGLPPPPYTPPTQ